MSYAAEIARSIKRYELADRAALREFQRVHFGPHAHQSSDEFAAWLFERNPHRDSADACLWVCKRDDKVVGQQASIPVRLKVGDAECRAAWIIDWRVHPDWHLRGVGPALLAEYTRSTDLLLGVVVEDAAYRAFTRTGWKTLGHYSLFVRPLDPPACASGLNAPRVAALAPRSVIAGTAALEAVALRFLGFSLVGVDAFDERVDGIWQRAKGDYPVISVRDFAAVRWRFDEIPYRKWYRRFYLAQRGRTLGYAVARLEVWHDGHVVGRIIDYLTPRASLLPLLALVIDAFRKLGAVAVFLDGLDEPSRRALWPLGFIRARESYRVMMNIRPGASPFAETLSEPRNWFSTYGDSDTDHIVIDEAASQCALR